MIKTYCNIDGKEIETPYPTGVAIEVAGSSRNIGHLCDRHRSELCDWIDRERKELGDWLGRK